MSEGPQSQDGSRADRRAALGIGLGIALYGNAFAVADSISQLSLGGTLGGALLGLWAWGVGSHRRSGWLAEFGIRRRGLGRSLLWGAALGLAMGLPGTLYLLRPDLAPVPIRHQASAWLTPEGLAAVVLLKLPLATALAEELAFRGLLQARLRAAFGPGMAITLGALVFTAWHLVVNFTTLQGTNLASSLFLAAPAYLGQNLAVLAAGLLFGLLRERSGNLAGPVLAHWLVSVLLIGGLYVGSRG